MLEKRADEVKLEELSAFCADDVPESAWLDYKQSMPRVENAKIAKIISAMASAHGGWVLLGIKEGRKEEMSSVRWAGIS